jgi:hypothetical protein
MNHVYLYDTFCGSTSNVCIACLQHMAQVKYNQYVLEAPNFGYQW